MRTNSREPRPGQIGKYWLSKKPGRTGTKDAWCRTWYDERIRQTRHVSLGTADIQEASLRLSDWVTSNERPFQGRAEDVLIDQVLLAYWEDHAQHTPSAETVQYALAKWQEFWAGRTVVDITPAEQKRFRLWLGEGKAAPGTIDKVLSAGRAALNRAARQQELTSAPRIFLIETEQDRQSRPPKGRPISIPEMAKLFDAATHRHVFLFLLLLENTLARSEAICDLQRRQFDEEHDLLDLNPPGRRQTKKYRPIVPVTHALRPWLVASNDPHFFYISFRDKRVNYIKTSWGKLRTATGIMDVNAYSFRHGMARELRKRKVPLEQIKLILGHKPRGSDRTTSIYAPLSPDYCTEAKSAIEEIMMEIRQLATRANFDDPTFLDVPAGIRLTGRHLTGAEREQLREYFQNGASVSQIAKDIGVSTTAIYKARKRLAMRK